VSIGQEKKRGQAKKYRDDLYSQREGGWEPLSGKEYGRGKGKGAFQVIIYLSRVYYYQRKREKVNAGLYEPTASDRKRY